MISSQDLRNKYEPFYDEMRLYLWPMDVIEQLGQVEVEIYTVFPDKDLLVRDFDKLKRLIKDVLDEDEDLAKATRQLEEVINSEDEEYGYQLISRVGEKNQEKDKVLKNPENDKEEDEELEGGVIYENQQSQF